MLERHCHPRKRVTCVANSAQEGDHVLEETQQCIVIAGERMSLEDADMGGIGCIPWAPCNIYQWFDWADGGLL